MKKANIAAAAIVMLLAGCGTTDKSVSAPVDEHIAEATDISQTTISEIADSCVTEISDTTKIVEISETTVFSETEISVSEQIPEESLQDPDFEKDALSLANSNAKHVFNAATSYTTDCEVAGYPVDEGWYFAALSDEQDTSYKRDGKDLVMALNYEMGYVGGYAAVYIGKDAAPINAIWSQNVISAENIDEITEIMSLADEDIVSGTLIGIYPGEILYDAGDRQSSTFAPLDQLIEANSNAKNVYANAAVYITDCEVRGYSISGGWHICKLEPTDNTELKKDGTDFDAALCASMGNYGGYAAVYIKDNDYPVTALWSPEFIDENNVDILSEMTGLSDYDIESGTLVGRYPENIDYKTDSNEDDHGSGLRSKLPPKDLLDEANSEAKLLFTNVATYCTLCEIEGNVIEEGWHTFEVTNNTSGNYQNDGKDMQNAVSYFMGGTTGYAAVHITENDYPDDVIWCHYPISADDIDNLKNISYMDNEQVYYDTVVGRYPEAVQLK